jgi:hypothetical protein
LSTIFVPRKISIGFQERKDTYTGKLAYVTYTDDRGVHRKKASWDGWRDHKIEVLEEDNVPLSGFVLNKKVGGYKTDYDMRQSYVRVYDPRGFEFEITIPNLIYVLENASSIKGKGLEGEFVYGWSGTELLLIPVDAPDYKAMVADRDALYNKQTIKPKELVLGATYRNRAGTNIVYMGRFQHYEGSYYRKEGSKLAYWFYEENVANSNYWQEFSTRASISGYLVATIDSNPVSNYADLFEKLEHNETYSPHDPKRDVFVPYTEAEFEKLASNAGSSYHQAKFWSGGKQYSVIKQRAGETDYSAHGRTYPYPRLEKDRWLVSSYESYYSSRDGVCFDTPAAVYASFSPQHKDLYLANGKFHRRES